MSLREGFKKHIWNNVGFWRFQFFMNLAMIVILILIILYLLGEYEHVVNELEKCMALGD